VVNASEEATQGGKRIQTGWSITTEGFAVSGLLYLDAPVARCVRVVGATVARIGRPIRIGSANEQIVALLPVQGVLATPTGDAVVSLVTAHDVVPTRPVRVWTLAPHAVVANAPCISSFAALLGRPVPVHQVVARATEHHVPGSTSLQAVPLQTTEQGVSTGLSLEAILAAAASRADWPRRPVRPSWVGGVSCDSDAKRANVGLRGRVSGSPPVQESWGGVDRAGEAAMQHR
jgi:hypothetical protein